MSGVINDLHYQKDDRTTLKKGDYCMITRSSFPSYQKPWQEHIFAIALWMSAPIVWGFLSYWMPTIPFFQGSPVYYQIILLLKTIVILGVALYAFGHVFEQARKRVKFTLFDHALPLPAWYILVGIMLAGIVLSFLIIPLREHTAILALVQGLLMSAVIEEFITHGIFIKYSMHWFPFLVINTINAIAFTFMHSYYEPQISCVTLLTRGHFEFNFSLGIIAYTTQRIEFPILIHMFANTPYPFLCHDVADIYRTTVSVLSNYVRILCIVGCSHRMKSEG